MRDAAIHRAVCERVSAWIAAQPGWRVAGIVESPVQGPAGNREFLLYARRHGTAQADEHRLGCESAPDA